MTIVAAWSVNTAASGSTGDGSPLGTVPDERDAVIAEVQQRRGQQSRDDEDQRPRHGGRGEAQPENQGE